MRRIEESISLAPTSGQRPKAISGKHTQFLVGFGHVSVGRLRHIGRHTVWNDRAPIESEWVRGVTHA
jgi:hypothetical protein